MVDDKFELVSSEEIIEELIKTLSNFKKPLSREDILHWASVIAGKAHLVRPEIKLDVVKDDPDDNKFIEAAIEGEADFIVTQDKHILKIKEYEDIKILTPEEFLEVINK